MFKRFFKWLRNVFVPKAEEVIDKAKEVIEEVEDKVDNVKNDEK